MPFILILAAIAIPNLLRARIAANEASAVGSIREINEAEISYKSMYPNVGYAPELSRLGGPLPCNPSPATACLLSGDLAGGTRHGYAFSVSGSDPSGNASSAYAAGAAPLAFSQSGVRRFCSVEDQIIRWDSNMERSTVPPDWETCRKFASLQ